MTKRLKPQPVTLSPEFVEDLRKVFEKHNWPGHPVGFVAHPNTASLGLTPCDPGPDICRRFPPTRNR